ncbi:hypothetical protein [Absidia glauca]|uniref:Uncharacterized protein n=1 Tax=Absidia glauca TaxID=4829 RepID=A0A163J6E5_ABSGL|nr:hypothetical protein [Absidia glauca]
MAGMSTSSPRGPSSPRILARLFPASPTDPGTAFHVELLGLFGDARNVLLASIDGFSKIWAHRFYGGKELPASFGVAHFWYTVMLNDVERGLAVSDDDGCLACAQGWQQPWHGVPECFVDMTTIGERFCYPMAILYAIKAKHENFSMMYDIACKLPKQINVSNQGGAPVSTMVVSWGFVKVTRAMSKSYRLLKMTSALKHFKKEKMVTIGAALVVRHNLAVTIRGECSAALCGELSPLTEDEERQHQSSHDESIMHLERPSTFSDRQDEGTRFMFACVDYYDAFTELNHAERHRRQLMDEPSCILATLVSTTMTTQLKESMRKQMKAIKSDNEAAD